MLPETGVGVESFDQARLLAQNEQFPLVLEFDEPDPLCGKNVFICKTLAEAIEVLDRAEKSGLFEGCSITVKPR